MRGSAEKEALKQKKGEFILLKVKRFKPEMILLMMILLFISITVLLISRTYETSCIGAYQYVALGDSYSSGQTPYGDHEGYGYSDFIKDKLAEAGILKEYSKKGVSGYTTEDVLQQLPSIRRLLAEADIITLDVGINDIQYLDEFKEYRRKPSPENLEVLKTAVALQVPEITRNLKQIIDDINTADTDSRPAIYLMGYFNAYPYLPELESVINSLNDGILSVAIETGVSYVHTKDVMDQDLKRYLPGDTHPTVEGYQIIAEEFWKSIYKDFITKPLADRSLVDVKGHWAEAQINKSLEEGIITGFSDGSFRPDRAVSRAEFITIINRYFHQTEKTEISFSDVPEHAWYRTELEIAAKSGYVAGNQTGSFNANEKVTRQEASVIFAKKMGFSLSAENSEAEQYEDWKEIPDWSLPSVNAMIKHGIMKGYPDNRFHCQGFVTRAEVLTMLDKLAGQMDSDGDPIE